MWRWLGIITIVAAIFFGIVLLVRDGEGLYLGLIVVWAGPFVLLLWYAKSCHIQ